jgi:uncharacterized protein (DUF1015 family)
MSTIRPFNAIRPNEGWYEDLLGITGGQQDKISLLKKLLEPRGETEAESWKLKNHLFSLETLLQRGNYIIDESCSMYVYERESSSGSQFGIWVLTSLQDLEDGKILKHEQTLSGHEERLRMYRREVGLEGSPVLLTYHRQPEISWLIENSANCTPEIDFFYEGSQHRLWSVKDEASIVAFQVAFAKLENVYVADGHHRLASAACLHRIDPQWITTLYVPAGQLNCSAFHRMVLPGNQFSDIAFLKTVSQYFHITTIAPNHPFVPSTSHCLGLRYKDQWYQLDLKEELSQLKDEPDVRILQDKILEPIFGIRDPRTDPQLISWPASKWNEMLEHGTTLEAILFILHPLSVSELLQQAEKYAVLPPKSTYIEPKVPYGLLLHNDKITDKKMKGILNA